MSLSLSKGVELGRCDLVRGSAAGVGLLSGSRVCWFVGGNRVLIVGGIDRLRVECRVVPSHLRLYVYNVLDYE